MYIPIEYKESEEEFLKWALTIRKNLFMFPYMEKIEEFIEMHFKQ